MKAYYLAMGLIIFNLSLPVVMSLGFPAPTGAEIPTIFSGHAITDWAGLLLRGLGMFAIAGLATIIGFRMNVGAAIFAVIFTVSSLPFDATLNWLRVSYGLAPAVVTLITVSLWFVFVIAFIQLCGVPIERD